MEDADIFVYDSDRDFTLHAPLVRVSSAGEDTKLAGLSPAGQPCVNCDMAHLQIAFERQTHSLQNIGDNLSVSDRLPLSAM
ncbi:MAG: hypothetical protein PW790_11015 [Parvibaculaceae bacterium]|nr:hypothetical protein [Parvibaculaceae bacterium]